MQKLSTGKYHGVPPEMQAVRLGAAQMRRLRTQRQPYTICQRAWKGARCLFLARSSGSPRRGKMVAFRGICADQHWSDRCLNPPLCSPTG
jgi:hypothetical protein